MKIAIVKLSALGDIVHAMIVLQFIKKYNQAIEIDWVVEDSYRELLEFHPDIKNIHVVNLKNLKKKKSVFLLIAELSKLRKIGYYDLVIDMQGLIKSALISRLIPSTVTLGFDKASIRESMASIFYNKKFNFSYEKNIVERNLELVKFALGLNYVPKDIKQKVPFLISRKKYQTPNILNNKKNILIIPGASLEAKIYPATQFSHLINELNGNIIVVWGSYAEKKIADEIKVLCPHIKVVEKLTIDSLVSLISQVDLVIGSDTGPTHMAWGLNIPSITLYGLTPGYRNSYTTITNRIIESNSKVNPLKINKNDFSIKDIAVNDIVKISNELLRG
tara:strand:+ start:560 stop:1558 length:999 start_codon:yes stop_codon:yes gene_type:complete